MGSIATSSQQDVSSIFNSYIAACGIASAREIGLFDQVRLNSPVNIDNFASVCKLDQRSSRVLVSALVTVDVVQYEGDSHRIKPGRLLEDAHLTKGLFHWLTLGSGSVFSRMQYIIHNKSQHENFFSRNSAAITYACRGANEEFIDPVFLKVMSSTGINFTSAVDLGSGSGASLMQVLNQFRTVQTLQSISLSRQLALHRPMLKGVVMAAGLPFWKGMRGSWIVALSLLKST
ncbi:methyltransferase [Fusarium sp. NRRL 52700]|nr:methyltransferase [Fusarium sp. NRRL 52700]